jgi:ATP-dependent Clp protease protease subunit
MLDNFKYIKNISTEGEGTILIYKQIGNSVDKKGNITYGITGADFGAEMLYLQQVCNAITVRINSLGGSVLDGYSIASSIYNSKVPVTTVIDGLAASTALWCAAAGQVGNRKAMDYGSGMIHGVSGGDDKETSNFVEQTINTILTNRSNKTADEIKSMMEKETWLNAQEMLAQGFIDEVITTNKKVTIKKNYSLENMALIYNKLINPSNMSKLNTLLKISNNADESEQENAVVNLNKELDTTKAELADAKKRLADIEAENAAKIEAEKVALKTEATEMVNKFEKEGKLSKEEVAATIENASKDRASFNFVSNLLSKLGNGKESKKPFDFSKVENKGGTEDRSTWTYNDWESKDVEGLKNLYTQDREKFNELVKTRKTQK